MQHYTQANMRLDPVHQEWCSFITITIGKHRVLVCNAYHFGQLLYLQGMDILFDILQMNQDTTTSQSIGSLILAVGSVATDPPAASPQSTLAPDTADLAEMEEGKVIQAPVMAPLASPKVAVKMELTEGEPSTPPLLGVDPEASSTGSMKVTPMVEDTTLPPCKE